MNESGHTYEWVISHIWMSHVTHMNESCHTYEWVRSHIWMSHVTHMNEACHTYEWVMSHIWMSHVTHMKESCHTYEWVIIMNESYHIWMGRVTHMKELCHTYERVMSRINESCHTYERVMSHMHLMWLVHTWETFFIIGGKMRNWRGNFKKKDPTLQILVKGRVYKRWQIIFVYTKWVWFVQWHIRWCHHT